MFCGLRNVTCLHPSIPSQIILSIMTEIWSFPTTATVIGQDSQHTSYLKETPARFIISTSAARVYISINTPAVVWKPLNNLTTLLMLQILQQNWQNLKKKPPRKPFKKPSLINLKLYSDLFKSKIQGFTLDIRRLYMIVRAGMIISLQECTEW